MAKITINNSDQVLRLARDNVLLRCGDCLHFKGTRHPSKEEQCIKLMVKPNSAAPECFTPNIAVFGKHSAQLIRTLALILRAFTANEHRVMMGLLSRAATLKGSEHDFFSMRYFALKDGTYLSDWCYGFVLSKSGEDNSYLLAGDSVLIGRAGLTANVMQDSLIKPKAFRKIEARLKEEGKVFRPEAKLLKKVKGADYEPPSIDSVDPEELPQAEATKPRKRLRVVATR